MTALKAQCPKQFESDLYIEQYADIFGFTLYNMGFKVLPEKIISKPKG